MVVDGEKFEPGCGPPRPVGERVRDLLGRITLREKTGQLNQRMCGWHAYRRAPGGDGFELTDAFRAKTDRFAGLGALYGHFRADAWPGVRHGTGPGADDSAALADLMERQVIGGSRLGIPACSSRRSRTGAWPWTAPSCPLTSRSGNGGSPPSSWARTVWPGRSLPGDLGPAGHSGDPRSALLPPGAHGVPRDAAPTPPGHPPVRPPAACRQRPRRGLTACCGVMCSVSASEALARA